MGVLDDLLRSRRPGVVATREVVADYGLASKALEVQRAPEEMFTALGITSRRSYAPYLAEAFVPVFPVKVPGNPDTDARFNFTGWATQAAVAAQNTHIGLSNPAGSGRVVYIDGWKVAVTNAGGSRLFSAYLTLAGWGGFHRRGICSRYGAIGAPLQMTESVSEMRGLTGVGVIVASAPIFWSWTPTGGPQNWEGPPHPIRLDAGQSLFLWDPTVNEGVDAAFAFREYPVELVPK